METGKRYMKVFRTVVVTGGAFVINYLITFFLTPYLTDRIGTEAYGFVSLAKNVANYAAYITVILNAYAARFISLEYFEGRMKQANIYFSSTFWGDFGVGSILLVVGLILVRFLEHIFQIPADIVFDVKILFILIFAKFWLMTVLSVYNTGAYLSNHLDLTGVFKGVSYVVEAVVLFVLFRVFEARVYLVGFGLLAATFVTAGADVWICKKYTGELHPRLRDFRFPAVKELVTNGIWSSLSSLGAILNSGLDLLVANLMISPLAMGQIAITETIGSIFNSVYTIIAEAFKPLLLKSYAGKNTEKLIDELKVGVKCTGLAANLIVAGFFAVGMVYYQLWIPHQELSVIFPLTMIVLWSKYLIAVESPLFYIYTLTLTRQISCLFTLITGVLNVLSMYVLIKFFHMGIYAVVGTTLVLQTIIHLLPHPLYMAHVLKKPWHTFYPEILRNVAAVGVMCLVFKGLSLLYMPTSWITLILTAIVYVAIGCVIDGLIVLNRSDWKMLLNRVRKILKKS